MRRYILLLWVLMCVTGVSAAVQVTASAPDVVVVGEEFRLSYKVNTQDVSDWKVPAFTGFEVLMGPSRSSESSFQMINGRTSQTSSITFTYILSATKEGNYTFPGATVTSGGKQYKSNSLKIQVLPADKAGNGASSQNGGELRAHAHAGCRNEDHRKGLVYYGYGRQKEGL